MTQALDYYEPETARLAHECRAMQCRWMPSASSLELRMDGTAALSVALTRGIATTLADLPASRQGRLVDAVRRVIATELDQERRHQVGVPPRTLGGC